MSREHDLLAELHERIKLEAQWRDVYLEEYFRNARYEILWWAEYGEPWRISVTWISNLDTSAGRSFLNRKE